MNSPSRLFGRRGFTKALGAGALAGLASSAARRGHAAAKKPAVGGIKFGYAAITWGEQGAKKAMSDIAATGFPGVQLRLNILKEFASPDELKAELAKAHLTFACLSGGGPSADPAARAAEVDKFMTGVKFARAAGALCVQATSPKRGATVEPAALKAFAETLNEIGKRTADLGLPLAFHHHMGQIGEKPEEVDAILAASDPRYVKLLVDTGHYAAAGGDPVKAIKAHHDRLVMLHIKDVADRPAPEGKAAAETPAPGGKPVAPADAKKYQFVELGQGKVDFPAVFTALKSVGYRGWAVVELDSVPAGRAPKDAAQANKAFLEKTLGVSV